MGSKKKKLQVEPEEFGRYTEHYATEDDNTPFITMWVDVSEQDTGSIDGDGSPYSGYSSNTETLEDYGVSIGAYLGQSYGGRSKALTKEHLGFMPIAGDGVFMIIEDYSTGSSFGNTEHQFRPVKIFKTRIDANEWLLTEEAERCKDTDYFGGHNKYLVKSVVVE